MIPLSNQQARQFILLKHGLLDEYKFIGKQGVLDFVHQAGCIQFDPVDSCGKNILENIDTFPNSFYYKRY